MKRSGAKRYAIIMATGLVLGVPGAPAGGGTDAYSLVKDFSALTISPISGAAIAPGKGNTITVRPRTGVPRSGARIDAPGEGWDLRPFHALHITLRNTSITPLRIEGRFEDPRIAGRFYSRKVTVGPGERTIVPIRLHHLIGAEVLEKLAGLQTNPRALSTSPPVNVAALEVVALYPVADARFAIERVRAEYTVLPTSNTEDMSMDGRLDELQEDALDRPTHREPTVLNGMAMPEPEPPRPAPPPMTVEAFFPFVDTFGQYKHLDWENKTKDIRDLWYQREREQDDLAAHPGPASWNKYGGWKDGPQMEATGYFYVAKHDDKWWLVDPEGKLFFSAGVTCVRAWEQTLVGGREEWFEEFPGHDAELGVFHRDIERDMFDDRKGYNVVGANVRRKYGASWQEEFADISHRRLRSWGLNTIGGWSHRFITSKRRTPYTVSIWYSPPHMSGFSSYSAPRREIDVFHPGFEKALREAMQTRVPESINDPWCIGYFVDNERRWSDRRAFGIAALRSRAHEPAKQRMVAFLRDRYADINELNQKWGSQYDSWQDLLDNRPDREQYSGLQEGAREDLIAFSVLCYDAYFKTIRDVLRDMAPNQLYLGCRFSNYNPDVVAAAARYCDVVSYNVYWARTMTDFLHGGSWPGGGNLNPNRWQRPGPDVPLMIGEFSFGTTDRGMFRGRLLNGYSENQKARADDYRTYMTSALRDPRIVGAHWFQYVDQPLTGRADGQGTQFGLLDVCDTPYWDLVQKGLRPIGDRLYEERTLSMTE